MTAEYRNPWHNPRDPKYGPAVYRTDAKPVAYRGYLIHHRIKSSSPGGDVYDIVKDGVCVNQYAGINGAKGYIDTLGKVRKGGPQ